MRGTEHTRGRLCQIVNPPIALPAAVLRGSSAAAAAGPGGITLTAVVAPHLLDGPKRRCAPSQHGLTAPRESGQAHARSGRARTPASPLSRPLYSCGDADGRCAGLCADSTIRCNTAGAAGTGHCLPVSGGLHGGRALAAAGPGGGGGGPADRHPVGRTPTGRHAGRRVHSELPLARPRSTRLGHAPGPVPCPYGAWALAMLRHASICG